MITSRFPLGDVSFSAEYFSTLVGEATKQCYGVAAMTPRDLTDVVTSSFPNRHISKNAHILQRANQEFAHLFFIHFYGFRRFLILLLLQQFLLLPERLLQQRIP